MTAPRPPAEPAPRHESWPYGPRPYQEHESERGTQGLASAVGREVRRTSVDRLLIVLAALGLGGCIWLATRSTVSREEFNALRDDVREIRTYLIPTKRGG